MTTSINQARERISIDPIYLVETELLNSGPTLYLSDRAVTVSGQMYEDYLSELTDIGAELRRADSSALNVDISLKFNNDVHLTNDYLIIIGDTYPFEGAVCTIKEVYLDPDGTTPSSTETLFVGFLDAPVNINLLTFECKLSSKEFIQRYKTRRG